MDRREKFIQKHITDINSRILELGPLNRPLVRRDRYINSFSADIRSTEEVRSLYRENDYLKATGIVIDPISIVNIDFVLKSNYQETFRNIEKFDFLVASHVLEHVKDIVFFFQDVVYALNENALLLIVWPDKRYCFDHFRESASFRDAYDVYCRGVQENARMIFDFFNTVIPENSPFVFWEKEDKTDLMLTSGMNKASEQYEAALRGNYPDDVHYWPFSEYAFLKFLYDMTRACLLPFEVEDFIPCAKNDQQFMVALRYKPELTIHPTAGMEKIKYYIKNLPKKYSEEEFQQLNKRNNQLLKNEQENILAIESLKSEKEQANNEIQKQAQEIRELKDEGEQAHNEIQKQAQEIRELKDEREQAHNEIQKQAQEIRELKDEREQTNNELQKQEKKTKQLSRKLSIATSEQLELQKKLEIDQQKKILMQLDIHEIKKEKQLYQAECRRLKEYYESSRSWRITKPLRKLVQAFKMKGDRK